MSNRFLLRFSIGERLYLVPREHVAELQLCAADHAYHDRQGRPLMLRDLGSLLDPQFQPRSGRRHTLVTILRRRSVGFLVDRADDLRDTQELATIALPPIIARRQANPWCSHVALIDEAPVLVLDLRRIAADVALGAV